MAQSAIRDYLRSKGLNDGDITYNNGTVMAKGQRFMDATPQADGRTYADTGALDNAYNAYDMRGQLAQMRTQATQVNPETAAMRQALKDRISRPAQQFSYDQNNDPAYKSALESIRQNTQTDMNNARVDAGAVGMRGGSLQNNQLAQVSLRNQSKLQNEITPQLMQQAYQRYIGQQQQDNAQTGQMMQLANMYDNQDQQQYGRMAQTLGLQQGYNQQQFANQQTTDQTARQKQQDHIALAQALSDRYGVQVNPTEDPSQSYAQVEGLTPVAYQQYLQQKSVQDAGLTGSYNGQDTEQKKSRLFGEGIQKGQLDISRQNANTSAFSAANSASNASANLRLNQDKFSWDKDPNNPDNKYKNDQLSARTDQTMYDNGLKAFKETGEMPDYMSKYGINVQGLKGEKTKAEVQGLYSDLSSGKLTPEKAIETIDAAEKLGLKDPEVIDQLRKTIYLQFPEYDPVKVQEQAQSSTNQNKFGHRMFGG